MATLLQSKLFDANTNFGSSAARPLTLDSSVSAGSTLVVKVWLTGSDTVSGVVDNESGGSNSFTKSDDIQNVGRVQLWYRRQSAGGATQVVCTVGDNYAVCSFLVEEWSGLKNQAPTDHTTHNNGYDDHVNASVTASADVMALSAANFAGVGDTATIQNGFTEDTNQANWSSNHKILSGYKAISNGATAEGRWNFSTTNYSQGLITCFEVDSGGTPGNASGSGGSSSSSVGGSATGAAAASGGPSATTASVGGSATGAAAVSAGPAATTDSVGGSATGAAAASGGPSASTATVDGSAAGAAAASGSGGASTSSLAGSATGAAAVTGAGPSSTSSVGGYAEGDGSPGNATGAGGSSNSSVGGSATGAAGASGAPSSTAASVGGAATGAATTTASGPSSTASVGGQGAGAAATTGAGPSSTGSVAGQAGGAGGATGGPGPSTGTAPGATATGAAAVTAAGPVSTSSVGGHAHGDTVSAPFLLDVTVLQANEHVVDVAQDFTLEIGIDPMASGFYVGNTAAITIKCYDRTRTLTDPPNLTLRWLAAGVLHTDSYLAPGSVMERVSTGHYLLLVPLNVTGRFVGEAQSVPDLILQVTTQAQTPFDFVVLDIPRNG